MQKTMIFFLSILMATMLCAEDIVQLEFVKRVKLDAIELDEPSGLAYSSASDSVWIISDNTSGIYKMDPYDFSIKSYFWFIASGLEGVAVFPHGRTLVAVQKETNRLLKIDVSEKGLAKIISLSNLDGYTNDLHKKLKSGKSDHGIAGITYNQTTDSIFIVREGPPGILIEISNDLSTILSYRTLGGENGFDDDNTAVADIDYEAISYDSTLDMFWVLSHTARRVYLYDYDEDKVKQSFHLKFTSKSGSEKEVIRPEGMVLNPVKRELYIACDKDARMSVYRIK